MCTSVLQCEVELFRGKVQGKKCVELLFPPLDFLVLFLEYSIFYEVDFRIRFIFLVFTDWNSALFIILNGTKEEHLDMLDGGIIQRLLEEKWKTFARVSLYSKCFYISFQK